MTLFIQPCLNSFSIVSTSAQSIKGPEGLQGIFRKPSLPGEGADKVLKYGHEQ